MKMIQMNNDIIMNNIKYLRTQYFQQLEDLYYEKYNKEWGFGRIDDIKAQFDDIVETILEYEGDKEKLFSEFALLDKELVEENDKFVLKYPQFDICQVTLLILRNVSLDALGLNYVFEINNILKKIKENNE